MNNKKLIFNLNLYEILTILLFSVLSIILALKHEPWADEAQAWLVARDSSWFELFTKSLRYEGSPGLWHGLLKLLITFHMPYEALNVFTSILSIISVYLLLAYSPFVQVIKCTLPFTYFIFYQYGIVARSYVLMVLLLFILASCYKQWHQRRYAFVLLCGLLANISLHCAILSGFIILYSYSTTLKQWITYTKKVKVHNICAFLVYCIFGVLAVAQSFPASDCNFAEGVRFSFIRLITVLLNAVLESCAGSIGVRASFPLLLMEATVTIAFFMFAFLLMKKRKTVGLFILPSITLILMYTLKHYSEWHLGIFFIYLIFVLWISTSSEEVWDRKRSENVGLKTPNNKVVEYKSLLKMVNICLCLIIFVQIGWTAITFQYDYRNRYSGGHQAADSIKEIGVEDVKIAGVGINCSSLQPYFARNLFFNINPDTNKGYWLWSKNSQTYVDLDRILLQKPDIIVVDLLHNQTAAEKLKINPGYIEVYYIDGALFWKDHVLTDEDFMIFTSVH